MKHSYKIILIILLCPLFTVGQDCIKTIRDSIGLHSVSFSPDNKNLATGSNDKSVHIYDVKSGELLKSLPGHESTVLAVAYSPEGTALVSGSWDKSVKIWNTSSNAETKNIAEHQDKINAISYSPDGRTFATASDDNTALVWDAVSGKILKDLKKHTDVVICLAYSNNGKYLATGSWDKTIIIWDLTTGLPFKTLAGHKGSVLAVSFSKDSKYLASGSDDHAVKLWDVTLGKELKSMEKHTAVVTGVAFSPVDNLLLSCSEDNTIKLWDITTGLLSKSFKANDNGVNCIAFSRNGEYLASVGEDNSIKIWDMSDYKYEKCIQQKLALYSDMAKPKDEFETTEQYNARLEQYKKIKAGLKQECINDDSKGVSTAALDSYKWVNFKISNLSAYNADAMQYQVTINNFVYNVTMPLDEAKLFKDSWQIAKVKAIERKVNEVTDIVNMSITHAVTLSVYKVGKQVSPENDKTLKEFLEKNK